MRERVEQEVRGFTRRSVGAIVAGVRAGEERAIVTRAPAGTAVDDTSVFEIGSVTKTFTAVLLAEMAARGEVALGDPLERHLPSADDLGLAGVTLEELATHRSGLPNAPGPMFAREVAMLAGLQRENPWLGVDEGRYHAMVRASRRRRGGRGIRYSSVGFGLLGDALAARAGRAYGDLLHERVLAPLRLDATGLDVPLSLAGVSRRGAPRPVLADPLPAAGALRSSVADLLRFLDAFLHPPAGPLGEALALVPQPRHRIGRRASVGLGCIVVEAKGKPRVVWHNGGTYGFRSFAGFAPGRDVAVAVLTNAASDVTALGHRLVQAALGDR